MPRMPISEEWTETGAQIPRSGQSLIVKWELNEASNNNVGARLAEEARRQRGETYLR